MWCRAVWLEGKREEEGVVPDNWICDKKLLWPPVNDATVPLRERREPTAKWKQFKLIKIKCSSGNDQNLSCQYQNNVRDRSLFKCQGGGGGSDFESS